MWAVARSQPAVVRVLLEGGADVEARTKAWYELVNPTGNEDGTGVEWVQQGGFTPLMFAARENDVDSARLLLDKGARIDSTAANGSTALVTAAHSNSPAVAKLLLERGADPNLAEAGYAAIHLAILHADLDLVKALLAHRANPNLVLERATAGRRASAELQLRPAVLGATPFWIAARFGEPAIMQALGGAGADPMFIKTTSVPAIVQPSEVNGRPLPEPAGMTALMAALSQENIRRRLLAPSSNAEEQVVLEAARIAVGFGVDVNALDEDGDGAMHRAARLRFNSVVQFLADNGARLDVRNKIGQTPLVIASAGGDAGRGGAPGDRSAGAGGAMTTADLLRKLGAKE
jgi:ankyrin repeat protein